MSSPTTDLLVFGAVLTARLLVPLAIPRFPLPAVLTALILDGVDQTIFQSTRLGYSPVPSRRWCRPNPAPAPFPVPTLPLGPRAERPYRGRYPGCIAQRGRQGGRP